MKRRNRQASLAVAAVGLALTALAASGDASAYCRTSICPGKGTAAVCVPAQSTDCGKPLYWASPCVGFSMQENASKDVSLPVATKVFEEAFATWMSADCGGGETPRIEVVSLGAVACDKHEYNQKAGNANIIMFRDDKWTHTGGNSTLALTTLTYNLDTGEIYDADMELNSAQTHFTTGDIGVDFDLLSIATHETGHFLGLAHSPLPDATMFPDYKPGSTSLVTLSADDVAGICAAYPPGAPIPSTCDPTPRHGFASKCGSEVAADTGCCTIGPGAPSRSERGVIAVALGALLLGARRRGRRR